MTRILLVTLFRNRSGLLSKAIQSVLAQSIPSAEFDYLLFDNGSEDNSRQIADTFGKKFKHIHTFSSPTNLGQQSAYNKILKEIIPKHFSKSTVMAILDDDDELTPNAILEVRNTYKAHPEIGGTYSGFSIIDGKNRMIVKDHGKAKLVPNQFTSEGQKNLRKLMVIPGSNPCGHLRTYSIKALNDIGGFIDERQYATDYAIFCSLMEKCPVVKIPKVLYKFRQHGNQVQGKHSPQQTEDFYYYQKYFRERWNKSGLI